MKPNPTLPYNDLPNIPDELKLSSEAHKAALEAAEAVAILKGQLMASFSSYMNSHWLLKQLIVPEAVASNGVENIVTTIDSALKASIAPQQELKGPDKEAQSYMEALELGQKILGEKGFLATNDYLAIQAIIVPNDKGIRDIPGYQLANERTGEVFYTPPEGVSLIRRLLQNFENFYNEENPLMDPIINLALIHYQFEAIHPFKDGNGRTGRMLLPLYLVKNDKLPLPILYLSRYILETKSEYYSRLRGVTFREEWDAWILYILIGVKQEAIAMNKALKSLRSLEIMSREKLIKLIPKRAADITEFIMVTPVFDREMFGRDLSLSTNTVVHYIQLLIDEGLIVRQQIGKRYIYFMPEYIALLNS